MRRLRQEETLHGTSSGQLPVDTALALAYGLTERENACATLLKSGLTQKEMAVRLGISVSTMEKHLRALREKLGVKNSRQAIDKIKSFDPEREVSIPDWPAPPSLVAFDWLSDQNQAFAERLRRCPTLRACVGALKEHLFDFGVRHLLYVFLPMNAHSFLKNDVILEVDATENIAAELGTLGALNALPVALEIYQTPNRHIVSDLRQEVKEPDNRARIPFLNACMETGCHHVMALGAPFGGGFIAAAALVDPKSASGSEDSLNNLAMQFRGGLMTMHNAAFAFGALASTAGLSRRERDALSLLACGHTNASAAEAMQIGSRAFVNLIRSAKDKLHAENTHEAIYKAAALNALVFL